MKIEPVRESHPDRRSFLAASLIAPAALASVGTMTVASAGRNSTTVSGKVTASEQAAVARLIEDFVRDHELPGLSLAMVHRGQLKLLACTGWADRESQTAVQPHHRFRVASVSKPITGATVVKLLEDQELSLDDPILGPNGHLKQYYDVSRHPNARNRQRLEQIKILHLLEHTCGGWGNRNRDPMFHPEALAFNHRQLIRWTLDHLPLESDPGTNYDYSNFGYCLLGRVIESVTGKSYQAAVKERILEPSGISKMAIAKQQPRARHPGEVKYYQPGGDPYGRFMNVRRMDAHGGWVASPTDLMRMLIHLDGFDSPEDILSETSVGTMTTPSSPDRNYAKGWSVNDADNWWHQGSFSGGSSLLARIHDGQGWAVTVNQRSRQPGYGQQLDQLPWKIKQSIRHWGDGDLFDEAAAE